MTFVSVDGYVMGRLVDISAGGLFAQIDGIARLGSEIVGDLDAYGHRLTLRGMVIRVEPRVPDDGGCGIAVEFDVPDERLWALLDDLDTGRIAGPRKARAGGAKAPPSARPSLQQSQTPRPPAPRPAPRAEQPFGPIASGDASARPGGGGPAAPPRAHVRAEQPFGPSGPPPGEPSNRLSANGAASAARPSDGLRGGTAASTGPGGRELRREPRYPVRLLALLDFEKIGGRAPISDLSAHGACVLLEGRLTSLGRVGQYIRLRLNFRELGHVSAWCRVVWVRPEGSAIRAGVCFFESSEDAEGSVAAIVRRLERPGGADALAADSLIRS